MCQGYCSAKHGEVYPSAYANGYATSVCMGEKPDLKKETKADEKYMKRIHRLRRERKSQPSNLQRWYQEEWVNVCEQGDGPGGFAICGSGKGIDNPEQYPYCRAYYKQPGTKVVTAQELTKKEIRDMCKKNVHSQGVVVSQE